MRLYRIEIQRVRAVVRDVDIPEIDEHQRGREPRHDFFGHEERQLVAARRHGWIVEVVEQRFRKARLQLGRQRAARLMHLPPEPFVPFVERRHHALGERLAILRGRVQRLC